MKKKNTTPDMANLRAKKYLDSQMMFRFIFELGLGDGTKFNRQIYAETSAQAWLLVADYGNRLPILVRSISLLNSERCIARYSFKID